MLSIYLLSVITRLALYHSSYQKCIANRLEVSTPATAFKRIIETNVREKIIGEIYSSDVFHDTPKHFRFYQALLNRLGMQNIYWAFIVADLLTGHCLYLSAKRYMAVLHRKQQLTKENVVQKDLLLKGAEFDVAQKVVIAYLFNPWSIFACVALSTSVFQNVIVAIFFFGFITRNYPVCVFSLVVQTVQNLYPVVLLVPLCFNFYKSFGSKIMVLLSILIIGYFVYAFNWIDAVYKFIITVPDQSPNVGLFWYFYTEMFKHFELMFISVHQLHVTGLYLLPLLLTFRKDTFLHIYLLSYILTILKTYPSLGEYAPFVALWFTFPHLHKCGKQIFISFISMILATAIAPIWLDLWLQQNIANVNFFFGATLAFGAAHTFLCVDIAFAYVKYNFELKNLKAKKNEKIVFENVIHQLL